MGFASRTCGVFMLGYLRIILRLGVLAVYIPFECEAQRNYYQRGNGVEVLLLCPSGSFGNCFMTVSRVGHDDDGAV